LNGCLRLRGPAKALDLALLIQEVKEIGKRTRLIGKTSVVRGTAADGEGQASLDDQDAGSVEQRERRRSV